MYTNFCAVATKATYDATLRYLVAGSVYLFQSTLCGPFDSTLLPLNKLTPTNCKQVATDAVTFYISIQTDSRLSIFDSYRCKDM